MLFFKNKNKKDTKDDIKEVQCCHKYKDFPWYIETSISHYNNNKKIIDYEIYLIEPYVCIKCHDRKNITLNTMKGRYTTYEKYLEQLQAVQEKYKDKIKERPEIEDMINDMVFVDREYLDLYEEIVKN